MYVVIELQTTNDQTGSIINAYKDSSDAEHRYHEILAAAAKSPVEIHSAVMLSAEGYFMKSEHYEHPIIPPEETATEEEAVEEAVEETAEEIPEEETPIEEAAEEEIPEEEATTEDGTV